MWLSGQDCATMTCQSQHFDESKLKLYHHLEQVVHSPHSDYCMDPNTGNHCNNYVNNWNNAFQIEKLLKSLSRLPCPIQFSSLQFTYL